MEWIALDVHIAGDPAVHRIASALKVRGAEVVGLLALTFAGMAQHAPTGEMADVPDTLLESWAHWEGKRGTFAAQFRAELCDETGLVTAWDKYNGRNIRRANASAERTRMWREKRETAHAEPSPNAHGNANGTHTSTHTERATVWTTGQDKTEQKRPTTSRVVARAPDIDRVIAHYRGVHPARRPGEKDRKAIGKALTLGYTPEELCEAIDGNAADPWHRERSKHELPYVLRDNGLIDGFRERATRAAAEDDEAVTDGVWLTAEAERETRPAGV
jgi:hypothetical protein